MKTEDDGAPDSGARSGGRSVSLDEYYAERIKEVDRRWDPEFDEFNKEMGVLLAEAKERLGLTGREWEKWVRENTFLSQNQARFLVKLGNKARQAREADSAE